MGRKLPSLSRALALCASVLHLAGPASAGELHGEQPVPSRWKLAVQQAGERSTEPPPQVPKWIKQANAFESQGAHGKAAELWEQVLAWSEKALGPDHPDTGASFNNLAEL